VEVGNGQWLLDPRNVVIQTTGFNPAAPYPNPFQIDPPNAAGAYAISRTAIQNALDAGSNVIVTTFQPARSDPGNITISSSISWSGSGSLTLLADNNILVNTTISSSGAGSLTLDAGNLVSIIRPISASGSGNLTIIGRGEGVTFSGTGNRAYAANGGNIVILAPGTNGDIIFGRTGGAGNWQMFAGGAGGITMLAGRDIQLGVPRPDAGWVRIGRDTDTGPVTISAGNEFRLLASPFSGVFAELRAGGPMTITAPSVLVQSTAQAPALLRAVGSQLTINAATGTFNGPLQSTANTLLSGGAYSFSVSPTLTLAANNSFTLAPGASISATAGLAIQTAGTGDIILNGPVSGVTLTADSADEMVIGAAINMSGAGNAIVLHGGRRIVNNAGAAPLTAPNGRWLTYSVSPFDDIGWELLNPDAPNLYGRSFGFFPPVSAPGTGNRRIYSFTPVLTYTAESGSKTYGGANPSLGVTVTGLVPGDNLADAVIGTPTVTSSGLALAAPVGSYATVPGGVTATEQGYALAFVNGVLTVTPAPLTVTADSLSKIYGDPDPALTFAVSGLVLGETPGAVLTGALARAPGETVAGGPYAITQGTLSANPNYSLTFVPGTFTITPAPLTVVANALSKVYGDADPALTFAASGFRLGDTAASVLTGALARAPGETVAGGPYAITQGTLSANANYTLAFTGNVLTITPALLSIVANAQSKVYGDPDPALTFAAFGFRLSDDASILSGALARAPGETVAGGPYAITQGTLGAGGNYDIAFTGADLSITPAPLLITPDSLSKAFGAPDPVFTFTASGFRLGDTAATALTGALSRQPGEAVGDYAILPGTLASTGNYALSFAPATFSIVARLLQVAANNAVKTYGQPDPVFTFTASGFAPGDDISIITGSLSRVPGETVGSYAITQGTLAATGYTIQFTPGVLTIDPALLTVIALNQSREYGLPDPVLTFTASGFQFGEDESILTGALARAPGETVGSYAITQGTLSAGANYVIGFTGAAFTITPALLTVVANALSKVYGGPDPALTFAASGFRLGDTAASVLTGTLARAPGETVAGGPYAITQGTLSANANYTLAFTGNLLTITPAPLSVSALASGKIYGDPDPLLGFTATGFRLGDTIASLSGSLARSPGENVGSYAITRGTLANPNYAIDFTGANFIISPALLRIIAAAQTREYGLPDPALTFAASGFRFNDTAASVLTGALARAAGEDVGTYAITQGTLAASPNYTIDFTGATLAITPAPLDVAANPQTKVYGNPDPVLTFAASGFRRGDTAASVLSGALSRVPGETVAGGPYAIVQGTLVSNPNYAIRFTGAGLTITPRPLSVALVGTVGRVYDATTLAPLSAANIQLSGVLPGDAVGVAVGDARYDTPNVGTGKLVTATGLTLTGAAAGNYSVAGMASAAIGSITPAPLMAVALDAERPFGLPNPPFQLQLTGLRGNDTAASIGLSATSSATPQSPPGPYVIEVVGNPLNYAVTRIPGTLTVLPALGFVRSAPEPVTVPALGGLVQQGVATGVHALNDTLDLAAGLLPPPEPVLRSTRYTIRVEPSPPPPGGLGGSSVFDAGAIRP